MYVKINFDVMDIFQKPAWHLISNTTLNMTFKICSNSDAIQNCWPTPKWRCS